MSFDIRDDVLKVLTVVTPLFASSIAIIYDVGFFFGLDIGFFTFFTFSEHLVFALQAIPFALPTALGILGFIAITWFGYHKVTRDGIEAGEKAKPMTEAEREAWLVKLRKQVARIKMFDPWVKTAFTLFAILLIALGSYTSGFLIFVSQLVSGLVYPVENLKSPTVRVSLMMIGIGGAWVAAFLVGFERSQAILTSKVPTETIFVEAKEIPAKLIRGGDRGVLFLSLESKKLNFLRWEAIKKIESL
jgi:hypothetical protein